MKKILLTTIHRPLGVNSDTCTPNIQAEMYRAQVTRAQGIFSIRSVCTGWGLDFIAANLKAPTTVLHYPTKRIFLKELRKGYDYVGIGFVICTFPKAIELCQLIRQEAPGAKIVLGGYGTVLDECDQYADRVCREEGVNFFTRLLDEEKVDKFKVPRIQRTLKIMSVTSRPEAIIPVGLGCSRGCDFCCTSHFFNRKYVPLFRKRYFDFLRSPVAGRKVFLLSVLDHRVRRALGRYAKSVITNPRRLFDRILIQTISLQQPNEVLNGKANLCDGCLNMMIHHGELIPSCRLDEYRMFGGPVVPVLSDFADRQQFGQPAGRLLI